MATRVKKDKIPCNSPRRSTRPGKKKMVKGCENGKEKIVHYGAKGYGHKCSTRTSKLTAAYWACKNLWAGKGGSTKSSPKGRKGKY